MNHIETYFNEVQYIAKNINKKQIEKIVCNLNKIKNIGRVFILGVGGSAGNASHMVNDLRKLCGIEAYAPTDNVSEITARTNDDGFETIFEEYLKISKFNENDCIFILSVGGGDKEKNVSVALIKAIDYVKEKNGKIFGIVGKDDGYTALNGDCVLVLPTENENRLTPHSESFQTVVWHCLVSHPILQINKTKW